MQQDFRIEIPDSQWKGQREERNKILKLAGSSQLSRDPLVLALVSERGNTSSYLANILGDGRNHLLAREIRGILCVDVVKRCGEIRLGLVKEDDG